VCRDSLPEQPLGTLPEAAEGDQLGPRPGASYTEPALRRAIVEFVKTLDLDDVTLAGESMGATVSLTASTELEDRVRRILAFNTYDYSEGVSRANRIASIYIGGARLPAIGPLVAKMENEPALGIVLRGGLVDGSKLPNHYLAELRRVGRRRGYPRVAREVYRNVDSMIAARARYGRITPRHFDLRRSRLVANPRAWSQRCSSHRDSSPTTTCWSASAARTISVHE
jgi:pimeloyl-ACP methyl ester carboxylesterase